MAQMIFLFMKKLMKKRFGERKSHLRSTLRTFRHLSHRNKSPLLFIYGGMTSRHSCSRQFSFVSVSATLFSSTRECVRAQATYLFLLFASGFFPVCMVRCFDKRGVTILGNFMWENVMRSRGWMYVCRA